MISIVFPNGLYADLREKLLLESPREAAAVLLAGRETRDDSERLMIREVVWLPPNAYTVQHACQLNIKPEFIAAPLKRAHKEGWSLVIVHSHPDSIAPNFSASDDDGERLLMPSVFARAPERPHASLIVGKKGFKARVWFPNNPQMVTVDKLL